jgi:hypothetical protein
MGGEGWKGRGNQPSARLPHAWAKAGPLGTCQHHSYELAPTKGQLMGWIDVVQEFATGTRSGPSRAEEATMFMRLPGARYLKSLARPTFASETELQRFFEKKLLREMGLRVVCSSRRGGGCMGNIDTMALDRKNRPVIIEYKRDLVDQATYDDKRVAFVKKVIPDDRATYGEDRAGGFSKARAFRKHLTKTTEAGRRAFKALARELRRRGFTRRFPGKNRVRYWKDDAPQAEVTLTPIGLQVLFRSREEIHDPEGRVGRSRKASLNRTVGILSPADVPYAVNVLCREGDASARSR